MEGKYVAKLSQLPTGRNRLLPMGEKPIIKGGEQNPGFVPRERTRKNPDGGYKYAVGKLAAKMA